MYLYRRSFKIPSCEKYNKSIILAGGYQDLLITKNTSFGCQEFADLSCNQTEADTRITLSIHATFVIKSLDTDVFILIIAHFT